MKSQTPHLTHEHLRHIHRTLKNVRFLQFGHKTFRHYNRDVNSVRSAWTEFQRDPLSYLANSPADLSRDVLTLCQ
ncbi:MAG: hypothetical protein WCO56_03295 [Verrucomicrobiota bacterium]